MIARRIARCFAPSSVEPATPSSNRRERNKTWFEEEDKARNERDTSPSQTESRNRNKAQDGEDKIGRAGSVQENIPSGPAADRRRGARDYHQSVRFRPSSDKYDREEDDDIPDDELERRRQEKKRRDLDAAFADVWPIIVSFNFAQLLERTQMAVERKDANLSP